MANFIAPQTYKALTGRKRQQRELSLHDKFRIVALIRDEENPVEAINAIITLPQYGHKPVVTGFDYARYKRCVDTLQKLIEADDPEAVKYGREYNFC